MTQPPSSSFPPFGGNNGNNANDNRSGGSRRLSDSDSEGYRPGQYLAGGSQAGDNRPGARPAEDSQAFAGRQSPDGEAEPGPAPDDAAGPWRRLAAFIIDALLIYVPVIGAGFLVLIAVGLYYELVVPDREAGNLFGWIGTTIRATAEILFFAYVTHMNTTTTQSLGKRTMGIAVVDGNVQPLELKQSALRGVWLLAWFIPVVGQPLKIAVGVAIFIFMFLGNKRQSLNDMWAKTQVVKREAVPAFR